MTKQKQQQPQQNEQQQQNSSQRGKNPDQQGGRNAQGQTWQYAAVAGATRSASVRSG